MLKNTLNSLKSPSCDIATLTDYGNLFTMLLAERYISTRRRISLACVKRIPNDASVFGALQSDLATGEKEKML